MWKILYDTLITQPIRQLELSGNGEGKTINVIPGTGNWLGCISQKREDSSKGILGWGNSSGKMDNIWSPQPKEEFSPTKWPFT